MRLDPRPTSFAFCVWPFLALSAIACQSAAGNEQHPDNNKSYQCLGTSFKASDQNNYSTFSDMKLPVIKVKPLTELSFDWGSVTKDFITHPLDPKNDLNTILVLLFQLPLADLRDEAERGLLDAKRSRGLAAPHVENQRRRHQRQAL